MYNALNGIAREMELAYNRSHFAPIGGLEEVRDDFLTTYETCESFRLSHEKDSETGSVYVNDDAFPDSFNHTEWLHRPGNNEYVIARSKNALRRALS